MPPIIKKKKSSTSGGLSSETTVEKKYTPTSIETGSKPYGKVGSDDDGPNPSPARKAMREAEKKAHSSGSTTGVAESGPYKGMPYKFGSKSTENRTILKSEAKFTPGEMSKPVIPPPPKPPVERPKMKINRKVEHKTVPWLGTKSTTKAFTSNPSSGGKNKQKWSGGKMKTNKKTKK